ncbi:MAG: CDP-alcohol phosphatidyltransferase family protein [Chloroflexi bacterium]|nr:CDP-alcohol phosphatidyltransferase family protein [Chloroflexota bacterium]
MTWVMVKEQARSLARTLAVGLARTGISPNGLTVIGLLLNVAVAAVLASGHLAAGGALLLLAGAFDMLDGALARATNQTSKFGAFFDSTLDRYSELVVFFGLLLHLQATGFLTEAALVYAAAAGSVLVSYARARAEALGFDCEVGLLGRPERILVLAAGLLFGEVALLGVLWLLAILTNATAVQRMVHVWRLTRGA